jgi:hypothetical protein
MSHLRQYAIAVPAASGSTDLSILTGLTVTSFHAIKTNGAGTNGDNVTLFKVSDGVSAAITNAVVLAGADQTTFGPSSVLIDDSTNVTMAGDTLRITATNSSDCACLCYVTGIPNLE